MSLTGSLMVKVVMLLINLHIVDVTVNHSVLLSAEQKDAGWYSDRTPEDQYSLRDKDRLRDIESLTMIVNLIAN